MLNFRYHKAEKSREGSVRLPTPRALPAHAVSVLHHNLDTWSTVNTSYKLEPYIPRVWGFWAYLFLFCYFFLFFDTFWFKFGSGTPPSVSRTINSTGFWPSFVQFRQIFAIFDQFLDRILVQKWGCWAYDFWSIGPRVSELKVKACDGVFTVPPKLLCYLIGFAASIPPKVL